MSKKGNDKAAGDHIQTPKQQFEMHKKLLEQIIMDTQQQLADVNFEPAKRDSDEATHLKQHIKYLDDQVRQFKTRAEELGQTLKLRESQSKESKGVHAGTEGQHRSQDHATQTESAGAKSEAGVQTLADPLPVQEAASVKPESVSASHQSVETFKSLAQLRSNLRDLEVQRD